MPRLTPAELDVSPDGTPFAPRYRDVYHSAASGPGQARHVFLAGNGLPQRWAGQRAFTILELGLGLGVNFLATWQAWRDDPHRSAQLHYVAIDRHPVLAADLERMLSRLGEFAPLVRELRARWPAALPGTHARAFDGGSVRLTIVFDEVESALRRLDARADAVYLDGFAPDRNPEMWSDRVMRGVARHAHAGTTCATWSASRTVRDALGAAGFDVERRPGFGPKRDMLVGRFAPRRAAPGAVAEAEPRERHAIVVGAGLAGASASAALAQRGWRITIVDAAAAPASGASSLFAGTFHPLVTRDDSLLARLSRAAFLHALDGWEQLGRSGHAVGWSRCGVLQLARHAEPTRAPFDAGAWPDGYAVPVDVREGAERSGLAVARHGTWYPDGGWACAPSLVRAWCAEALATSGAIFAGRRRVVALRRAASGWTAHGDDGGAIASAPVVVLANATDLARLAPLGATLASVRGQVSYLPATAIDPPRAVVIGPGYVLPPIDGRVVVGSSYDTGSTDPAPDLASHQGNLTRLAALAPGLRVHVEAGALEGGVGFRAVVPDRMPLIGPLPDLASAPAGPAEVPPLDGLFAIGAFGSRGLTWAALAGELLAAHLDGGPLPVETDLAAAVDPRRFVRRARRRGRA
jgi:tRNA 5-methylaminomethyl-2-thiouridine biosynthesis bifunctional protein